MLHLIVSFKTKENSIKEFQTLLIQQQKISLSEPGCLSYRLLHDREDPTVFFTIEAFESEAAFDIHKAAIYTQAFITTSAPLLTQEPVINFTHEINISS